MIHDKMAQAITNLRAGAKWVLRGNEWSGLEWLDQVQTRPTDQELQAEYDTL